MMARFARPAAWLLLAAICFVTLAPIELRPTTSEPADLERIFAFAILGLIFALGYPRHWVLVVCLVAGAAFAFEFAQIFASTRHARLEDATVKALGGGGGVLAGMVVNRMAKR